MTEAMTSQSNDTKCLKAMTSQSNTTKCLASGQQQSRTLHATRCMGHTASPELE